MSSDTKQPKQQPEGDDIRSPDRKKANRRGHKKQNKAKTSPSPSGTSPSSLPPAAEKKQTNGHRPKPPPHTEITQHRHRHNAPKKKSTPADMTVIVNRLQLWDVLIPDEQLLVHSHHRHQHQPHHAVAPYHFAPDVACWVPDDTSAPSRASTSLSVAVAHAPRTETVDRTHQDMPPGFDLMDTSFPNPHPPEVVHDKYWAQRRRLFSRFDMGVQLDSEGWFSVTPEIIADHVAQRVGALSTSSAFRRGTPGSESNDTAGIVVLDAFCGCGGNAIAFGRMAPEQISLVVCVDMDRSKLQKAAYNASLYDIPNEKLIFVECNTMFIIGQCYKDGELRIDDLRMGSLPNMPPSVPTESYAGYSIGGLNLLPQRIDAVFMDPPWGGVDYYRLKEGYDLRKHMKIRVGPTRTVPAPPPTQPAEPPKSEELTDDFFDSFGPPKSSKGKSDDSSFNDSPKDGEYVNGVELVRMAAAATHSRLVIYDLPRNTNMKSLGEAALAAGYRGNLKLEEHHLNGRLKTVTAYLGADYSHLLK